MKRIFKSINCINCNILFIPTTSRNKTCSKKCLQTHNYKHLPIKQCTICDKNFKHIFRETCSDKCYFKLASNRSLKTNLERNNFVKNGLKRKGKSYEFMYGKEKANKISNKMSVTRKKNWVSGKIKINSGNFSKGCITWNKNIKGSNKNPVKNKTYVEYFGIEKANKISNKISNTITQLYIDGVYKNCHKSIIYKDNYLRSSWELKVAQWLDQNNIEWEYESKNCRFKRPNGKYYIVDFYLPKFNRWIEVKGWWDEHSIEKCNDFINVNGEDSLIIIDKLNINNINLDKLFYEYTPEFINGVDQQIEEMRNNQ